LWIFALTHDSFPVNYSFPNQLYYITLKPFWQTNYHLDT
jgi:hypothetical protein